MSDPERLRPGESRQALTERAAAMGLPRNFPAVGPANVRGIEINAYAAELARVSVWIGEIQWMRRNGFNELRDPILKPLETIECRDAILTPEGGEPEWPAANVVIGNSPFLGVKLLNAHLGEAYVSGIFRVYPGRVPAEADLVCYWFVSAAVVRGNGGAGIVTPPGPHRRLCHGGASSQKIAICRSVIASKLVSRKCRSPSAAGASWRSR